MLKLTYFWPMVLIFGGLMFINLIHSFFSLKLKCMFPSEVGSFFFFKKYWSVLAPLMCYVNFDWFLFICLYIFVHITQ